MNSRAKVLIADAVRDITVLDMRSKGYIEPAGHHRTDGQVASDALNSLTELFEVLITESHDQ